MILRRAVENLKRQHWTSVFVELAIVVLGVFIANFLRDVFSPWPANLR